ncbi:sulfurtransferase [Corynebacterium bovis]|uniref:thiosulfate sulfurtransferase n=1 Tax=Corynebacterium bovis DSM 20582 = CIP 54.80 TaxID=927655 RepID=A0A8H9YA03_9CORY|nr:rhodanese-like domain-containing protein [Corynebacterium bovis]MBB3116755.1 thiosulfate/3-mercaptopyruvate sulfurtransferase [Corynebacterium bovis DSM 20582 = CIP 54.80]QQC46714.1 sulfurtransferase [Corynebacterium bovis]RRO91554.1 sulfurtransferase [Corynebacterium bovis]RRO98048.1 sulfurtransferase [Corynebacterium bovis]RRQ07978.1 sulfurtransferase [Corynebacterium bovis]
MTASSSAAPAATFVTGDDLLASLTRGDRVTVLDSNWHPGENSSWLAYVSQHIPGAMFCDPLAALAGTPARGVGRNPLPQPDVLQRHCRDWGIDAAQPVRIYDAGRNLYAARAWWVLRWAGHPDVAVLNGGTPAWEAAGGDVAGGVGALRGHGRFTVEPGSMPVATLEEVAEVSDALTGRGDGGTASSVPGAADVPVLVDAREESRYTGRREALDRQAGHIPGAVSVPVWELTEDDGTVAAPEVVRERLAGHGVTSGEGVIVYSGSGLHSSLFLAAMEYAGLTGARHYVGGWSQWAAVGSRPVDRGI